MKRIGLLGICIVLWLGTIGCGTAKGDWETGVVTISVSAYNAVQAGYGLADEDGYLLKEKTVEIKYGETVFDATKKALQEAGIAYEKTGSGMQMYINSINGLAAQHYGEFSGWMFYVNGAMAEKSCGEQELKPNDQIVWEYSVEMDDTPVSRAAE